jgi:hypothetical protein
MTGTMFILTFAAGLILATFCRIEALLVRIMGAVEAILVTLERTAKR